MKKSKQKSQALLGIIDKSSWNASITSGAYRVINLHLLNYLGDVESVLVLEELIDMYFYLKERKKIPEEDIFFYTDENLGKKLKMSIKRCAQIRKLLIEKQCIEVYKRGIPRKNWYKINFYVIEPHLSYSGVDDDQEIGEETNVDIQKQVNAKSALQETPNGGNSSEIIIEQVVTKSAIQLSQNGDTGSAIMVEQVNTNGGIYIEKERRDKEEEDNERIDNKTQNDIIEAFEVIFNLYPKSSRKEECQKAFLNLDKKSLGIVINFIIDFTEKHAEIDNQDYPTLFHFLTKDLWKLSFDEFIEYMKTNP